MEISIDILHLLATCRYKISSDIFFLIYLKIPMIFAFAFKTSVKHFIDILSLFAKCRWKFLSTSFYLLRISMIFCFCLAKRLWKISSILCIYFQNVDGNFHRRFASISKSESNLQGFDSNISGNKFTQTLYFGLKYSLLRVLLIITWVKMSKFALS